MFKLHNWVQELVQSFTFYGDRAGGGGTVGGGKPSSLATQGQPNMPSQPMFAGGGRPFNLNPALVNYSRPPNLAPQNMGQPTQQQMFQPRGNLNPALVNYSRPPNLASQGMPTMPQGMNQPQGLPMQGGQFAGDGRPFNPQANQNAQYLMNFSDGRFPQGMPTMPQGLPQSQGLPMQGGAFAGGGRPFSAQAIQNMPYLINNKPLPNFTS